MEEANPVAYTEAGNHASFPSHSGQQCSARSAGVQSTASHESGKQDTASGRQTQNVSSRARPLTAKSGETEGGLSVNYSSNTGMRVPSSSILNALLLPSATVGIGSDTTDSKQMLLQLPELILPKIRTV